MSVLRTQYLVRTSREQDASEQDAIGENDSAGHHGGQPENEAHKSREKELILIKMYLSSGLG